MTTSSPHPHQPDLFQVGSSPPIDWRKLPPPVQSEVLQLLQEMFSEPSAQLLIQAEKGGGNE
jgi:hypothetical protein